jgi:hypothetical protein
LLQDVTKQKAEGTGGLIDAGVGELAFLDQVQQVGLDLFGPQTVRGAAVVLGQGGHARQVGFPCAQGKASQHHRIVHPLA